MAKVGADIAEQYDRMWEMLRSTIGRFTAEQWVAGDRLELMPARWAFHIVATVDNYTRDAPNSFDWNARFQVDWENPATTLPSQQQLLVYIDEVSVGLRKTLLATPDADFAKPNGFPWTGDTLLQLRTYDLRHSMYHLGELSMLLRIHGATETEWC